MSAMAIPAIKNESLNIQALKDAALNLWERDQASAVELGKALIAVRDALRDTHGAFTSWYREHNLEENRVHYCIRKVEGKIKPASKSEQRQITIPEPDFHLNECNLAVTKFASPSDNGCFAIPKVLVSKDGTTATDGFVLAQVSLAPEKNGDLSDTRQGAFSLGPINKAAKLLGKGEFCAVSVREGVIQANDTFVQSELGDFPDYKRAIPKGDPVHELHFDGRSLRGLIDALDFAEKFSGDKKPTVKLSFHDNNMVRIDCEPNEQGQEFFACVMHRNATPGTGKSK